MKKPTTTILKILLLTLFSMALTVSVASIAVSLCFSPHTITDKLEKQDFSAFAMSEIAENLKDYQSVISVPTESLVAALPLSELEETLYRYTDGVSRLLLAGEESDLTVSFSTAALEELIHSTITPAHYADHIQELEKDRADAMSEITNTIRNTLSFFPASLFEKVMGLLTKDGRLSVNALYRALRIMRYALFPALLILAISAALLIRIERDKKQKALRSLAGNWFITASVLFLPTAFLSRTLPLNRLSLSDCLLRRYILALGEHLQSGVLTVTCVCFLLGLLLLLFTLYLSAKSTKSSCIAAEDMIK